MFTLKSNINFIRTIIVFLLFPILLLVGIVTESGVLIMIVITTTIVHAIQRIVSK